MDLMLLRMFQKQTLFQCRAILISSTHLNEYLNKQDTTGIFFSLQNLLNSAANVSKALYGQSGKYSCKRKPLRDSIGIKNTSVFKTTSMRNHFEHFDERLDKWWKESQRHNNFDFSVMPKSSVKGIDPIDWFRVFDPSSGDMYFWNQEFNIKDIISEVQSFLPQLEIEANKPHWEE
jgi:hypothetical protein